MRLITFVFSTLVSISAFADFSGNWKGQGHMVDGGGNMQQCKEVTFELTQTDANFALTSGVFDCELFRMKWMPMSLEIKDGELLSNGVIVGTISEDLLFARQQSENGLIGIYQAELIDGGLNFKETLTDAEGNIIFSVEADLTK